jgi:hypothetical protein
MNLSELFIELQKREDSNPSGLEVSEAEISAFELTEAVSLPESYRCFLAEFGIGGEFVFARMRALEDEAVDAFWDYWREHLGVNARMRYLPFGDDYAGNYYCFELESSAGSDCPIVLIDDALIDNPDNLLRFESFAELIETAIRGMGVFA